MLAPPTSRALRLQVMSDVHFEFHEDDGAGFVQGLLPHGVDVLVVAGDLCGGHQLQDALPALAARYPQVVYVSGNHELYGFRLDALRQLRERLVAEVPNLSWLDGSAATIDGVRFVGATLWFPDQRGNRLYSRFLNDFRHIPDFPSWVYRENAAAVAFLQAEVRPGDVVVSHHLPSARSVPPRWQGDPLNRFFLTDLGQLIEERRPALWIHGHTHETASYRVGPTRVVCNPYGYEPDDLNPDWQRRGLVEVTRSPPEDEG